MTLEQTEFLISQYADGTIAPADRATLESRLAADPAARRLLDEYRQLDALLRTAAPATPSFDYDAIAARINAAIDDHNTAARPIRLHVPWVRIAGGLAVAACVLLAVGLWLRPVGTPPTPTVATTADHEPDGGGVIQVAVLQPADARLEFGPGLQQIQVGPPAGLRESRVISEAIVTRPNTLFIAKADGPAQDTSQSLY